MGTKTIHDYAALVSLDVADELLAWDTSAGTTRKITFANFGTGLYLTTTTGLMASGAVVGAASQAQLFTNSVGIGGVTPSTKLHVLESNAATAAIFNMVTLSGRSTGTAAPNFGVGLAVQLESNTTNDQEAGRITWAWDVATHASRAARGKLTAYYTTTEREIITWVANSTNGRVGINQTAPVAMLHVGTGADTPTMSETIGYFSNAGTTAIAVRDSTNDAEAVVFISAAGAIYGTMTVHPVFFRVANNDIMSISTTGYVGIGTTSPQAKFHVYDGSGGCIFVNRASVGGSLVTVIPDGTGDVTERLHFFGVVSNSAAFVAQVNEIYLDVSTSTTKTDGVNTLTIAVTAAGAFTLQATAGAATWKVLLWAFWR